MSRQPPDFKRPQNAYCVRIAADRSYVRPWLGYADMAYRAWDWRGAQADRFALEDGADLLEEAVSPPRNPTAWSLHMRRAEGIRQLLQRVGSGMQPTELTVTTARSSRRSGSPPCSTRPIHAPRPAGRGQRRDLDVRRRHERGGGGPAPRRSPHKAPRQEAPGRGTRTPRGHADGWKEKSRGGLCPPVEASSRWAEPTLLIGHAEATPHGRATQRVVVRPRRRRRGHRPRRPERSP